MMNSVLDRCRAVATFRHVSVRLMEIVAGWTPTTPEMEVKVMFGRHIWGFAQMADALGKRTFELRRPMHFSLAADASYEALLDMVSARTTTGDRVAALYDGVIPGLIGRYRGYTETTDRILDEPSIDIIDRIVVMLERQRADALELNAGLGLDAVALDIRAREASIPDIVAEQAIA